MERATWTNVSEKDKALFAELLGRLELKPDLEQRLLAHLTSGGDDAAVTEVCRLLDDRPSASDDPSEPEHFVMGRYEREWFVSEFLGAWEARDPRVLYATLRIMSAALGLGPQWVSRMAREAGASNLRWEDVTKPYAVDAFEFMLGAEGLSEGELVDALIESGSSGDALLELSGFEAHLARHEGHIGQRLVAPTLDTLQSIVVLKLCDSKDLRAALAQGFSHVLESGSPSEQEKALRLVRGSRVDVQQLALPIAKLLCGGRKRLHAPAEKVFGSLPEERQLKALVEVLHAGKPKDRERAVNLLAPLAGAAEVLREHAASEKSAAVREAIEAALGSGPAAKEALGDAEPPRAREPQKKRSGKIPVARCEVEPGDARVSLPAAAQACFVECFEKLAARESSVTLARKLSKQLELVTFAAETTLPTPLYDQHGGFDLLWIRPFLEDRSVREVHLARILVWAGFFGHVDEFEGPKRPGEALLSQLALFSQIRGGEFEFLPFARAMRALGLDDAVVGELVLRSSSMPFEPQQLASYYAVRTDLLHAAVTHRAAEVRGNAYEIIEHVPSFEFAGAEDRVWQDAFGQVAFVREAAQKLLAQAPDVALRICERLDGFNRDARRHAAQWLGELAVSDSFEAIEGALQREKDKRVAKELDNALGHIRAARRRAARA